MIFVSLYEIKQVGLIFIFLLDIINQLEKSVKLSELTLYQFVIIIVSEFAT